jgi:small GTP-binding protein
LTEKDPIATAVTPLGEAGVAVYRYAGPDVARVLATRFVAKGRRPILSDDLRAGTWRLRNGLLEDCVIRTRFDAAPPTLDVSTHGGIAVDAAMGAARPVDGVSGDGAEAEADRALDEAFADEAVRFFSGAGFELAAAARAIADGARRGFAAKAREAIDALLGAAAFGLAMSDPPVVALLGAVNAGKSTLFNALVGSERAAASETPGTTRDVVEEPLSRRGFPLFLRDGAGVRDAADPVEREGVARAVKSAVEASTVVLVFDAARPYAPQRDALPDFPKERAIVRVLARADLSTRGGAKDGLDAAGLSYVACSARDRVGIDAVADAILRSTPFSTRPHAAAPFLSRHVAALAAARAALDVSDFERAATAALAIAGDPR